MGIFKNNITLALVAIMIVSLAGGYYLTREPADDGLLVSDNVAGQDSVERELLASLLQLKSLKFQPEIFADPAFTNLKDFSREIPNEDYGRNNPFAPVGQDAPRSVNNTSASSSDSTDQE